MPSGPGWFWARVRTMNWRFGSVTSSPVFAWTSGPSVISGSSARSGRPEERRARPGGAELRRRGARDRVVGGAEAIPLVVRRVLHEVVARAVDGAEAVARERVRDLIDGRTDQRLAVDGILGHV